MHPRTGHRATGSTSFFLPNLVRPQQDASDTPLASRRPSFDIVAAAHEGDVVSIQSYADEKGAASDSEVSVASVPPPYNAEKAGGILPLFSKGTHSRAGSTTSFPSGSSSRGSSTHSSPSLSGSSFVPNIFSRRGNHRRNLSTAATGLLQSRLLRTRFIPLLAVAALAYTILYSPAGPRLDQWRHRLVGANGLGVGSADSSAPPNGVNEVGRPPRERPPGLPEAFVQEQDGKTHGEEWFRAYPAPGSPSGLGYAYERPRRWNDSEYDGWSRPRHRWPIANQDDGDRSTWQSPTMPLPVEATLEERLQAWRYSPNPEAADWIKHNLETCSTVGTNQNNDLVKNSHLVWATLNRSDVMRIRDTAIDYLLEEKRAGRLRHGVSRGNGRGMVWTAGNVDTFHRVLVSLRLLRSYDPPETMPAEIFHFPTEEPSEQMRSDLAKLNATVRILPGSLRKEAGKDKHHKNFFIKAGAIVHSSFKEVVYIDSDNIPSAAVSPLFDSKAYKRLGTLFWPDYWKTSPDNMMWILTGTQCRDEWEQEAGQMVIDKERHLDMLLLAEYMLLDYKFWFHGVDGDKDAFRFAMLALRKRWGIAGRHLAAGALGFDTQTGFCGHTMMQYDHRAQPLFVHANLLKQIPSGLSRGSTWGRTRQMRLVPDGQDESEIDGADLDLDADHLANARTDGTAIAPAPPAIRWRAAIERGLVGFFHGGGNSAFCIDMRWKDPRSDATIARDAANFDSLLMSHAAKAPVSGQQDDHQPSANQHQDPSEDPNGILAAAAADEALFADKEIDLKQVYGGGSNRMGLAAAAPEVRKRQVEDTDARTKDRVTITVDVDRETGEPLFALRWDDPLQVVSWSNYAWLKDFENRYYDAGGQPGFNG